MATDLTTETQELTPELLRQVHDLTPEGRKELRLYLDELDELAAARPPLGPDRAEVRRRLEDLRDGKVELLDGEQVLSEMWARLLEKGLA